MGGGRNGMKDSVKLLIPAPLEAAEKLLISFPDCESFMRPCKVPRAEPYRGPGVDP